jgi:hypothetical protein
MYYPSVKRAALRKLQALLAFCLLTTSLSAQRIVYSEPEKQDGRSTSFEIIGKFTTGNVLIFKNLRDDNDICVYDNDMKLKERVKLGFMPDRMINADFIAYPDHCMMVYQFEKKNIVHCMGVKIDGNGQKIGEPFELDTTRIGSVASNKIYSLVVSDDKQKIVLFKINTKNPKAFAITTLLFNPALELQKKSRCYLPIEERNDMINEFAVDNDGDFVFGKFRRHTSGDFVYRIYLVRKAAQEDSLTINDIEAGEDRYLDDVKIKVDNGNKRCIISCFYYKQRRGNIEGLYTAIWDKTGNRKSQETLSVFSDELRQEAKGRDNTFKGAFNDYFIRNIIPRKDGGYLLASELLYSTSRGGASGSRWDNMWGTPYWGTSAFDYYSPFYNYGWGSNGWSPWGWNYFNPWNRWGNNQNITRYYAENILILSYNKDGQLDWSNLIPKNQFDDETDNLLSYQLMNTGGQLHFLFNQNERRNLILNDQNLSPDGQLNRNATLKNLDKGYEFMPRFGKQIGSKQTIIPCMYRNYLCFAKIDF